MISSNVRYYLFHPKCLSSEIDGWTEKGTYSAFTILFSNNKTLILKSNINLSLFKDNLNEILIQ